MIMNRIKLLLALSATLLLLLSLNASADTIQLRDGHPDRHIVVKGDTLWDISAHFLKDPWRWPEIWQINPAIENPHLIYPGDIVLLEMVNGKPVLKVMRDSDRRTVKLDRDGHKTVKLTPQIRASKLEDEAIPSISSDAIKQFLKYPRIVSQRELDDSGYIVASEDGGLISGSDDKIYARGITQQDLRKYDIVRQGKVYRGAGWHGEVLGIEMLRIADAQVERFDDPASLRVTNASREILIGDRLLPATHDRQLNQSYLPHAPEDAVKGSIIAVLDGVSRIGQFHTVVINLGKRDKMEAGHVLAVYQAGETVRDPVTDKWQNRVTLPDERAGIVMIVHPFERVSYALVMEADRDMRVMDVVTNP